jgi:hypothetical protein
VSAHAFAAAMMNGPDFEIDGLEAAKGSLDVCQTFKGADGRGSIERLGPEVGAQDIDSSEQVAAFNRNAWPRSTGIPGRNRRNPQSFAAFLMGARIRPVHQESHSQ